MKIFNYGIFIVFLLVSISSYSQKKDKMKLERADVLEGGVFKGRKINKFIGNVWISQKETNLYADSVYQYRDEKSLVEAFGNVRITQGDSISITGNRLTYNGETKKAVMTGNVFLRDKTMTLTTNYLEFDLISKLGTFTGGGTINDGQATLTCERGTYNTRSKTFHFKNNVKVVNPVKNFTLTTDTLHYNTVTNIATFKGPTHIESPQGVVDAAEGQYNTQAGRMVFAGERGGATVISGSYQLTGDYISYDEKKQRGVVRKNVKAVSEKDNIIIYGDEGHYWEDKGISKIFGNVVMKSVMSNDTLFMTADTLISIDPPNKLNKRLLAFNNVKIFKSDLQGTSDSMAYNFGDSTIYFYVEPVLWSGKNQITADSINVQLKNNRIHRMNMNQNSFIVSMDTIKNFNQVKGRNMTGYFKEENLYQIDVNGNGESVYFALENEVELTGMNKVACSNMIIRLDSNKVKSISFIKKPDGKFVPPDEIQEPDTRLKGFVWRQKDRPELSDILNNKKEN